MTSTDVRCLALSLGVAALVTTGTGAHAPSNPPMAKKAPKTSTLHGVTWSGDYHWLRDKGWPEVTAYLEAENAYTAVGMKHTAALQETLYTELLGRIKEDDQAPPYRDDAYWYYARTCFFLDPCTQWMDGPDAGRQQRIPAHQPALARPPALA